MRATDIRTLYGYNEWANERIFDAAMHLPPVGWATARLGYAQPHVLRMAYFVHTTQHATRTTHHATRNKHHAPRTTHYALRNTHYAIREDSYE